MWEILSDCVNLFHGHVKIFVGISMDKLVSMEFSWIRKNFYAHEILVMDKFCRICDVGSWKILWL